MAWDSPDTTTNVVQGAVAANTIPLFPSFPHSPPPVSFPGSPWQKSSRVVRGPLARSQRCETWEKGPGSSHGVQER
jgi:hypothetical protein